MNHKLKIHLQLLAVIIPLQFLPGCLSIKRIYITYPVPVQSYGGTLVHITQFPYYANSSPCYRAPLPGVLFCVFQSLIDLPYCIVMDSVLLPATLPVDIYGIFYPEDFEYYRAELRDQYNL